MKSLSIKSFLFLAIFAVLTLVFAQAKPTAAQTIGETDPPVFLTDLACTVVASTDYWGQNVIPTNYSGYVDELWIRVIVENKGPAATAQAFTVSKNVVLNGGSIDPFQTLFVPPLAAGETYQFSPVYVDLGAPLASLQAFATVDIHDVIPETWENRHNRCYFNYFYQNLHPAGG